MKWKITCYYDKQNCTGLTLDLNECDIFSLDEEVARELAHYDDLLVKNSAIFDVALEGVDIPEDYDMYFERKHKFTKIIAEPIYKEIDITWNVVNCTNKLMDNYISIIKREEEDRERKLYEKLKAKYEPAKQKKDCPNGCRCRSCE